MAESTLTPTIGTLRSAVSDFLGTGLTPSGDDLTRANTLVEAGIRQFLFPPIMDGETAPHRWSFMSKTTTLVVNGAVTALPDDFGMLEGDPSLGAGAGATTLRVAPEDRIREMQANYNTAGAPRLYCVRALTFTNTTGQRWEMLCFPIPTSVTLTYSYQVNYDTPVDAGGTKYAPGGLEHSETLIASCLAIAEARHNDEPNGYWSQRFVQMLAQSITRDRAKGAPRPARGLKRATTGTFGDLSARVGESMGWGLEPLGQDLTSALDLVREGYRRFLAPKDADGQPYHWSFLNQTGTITTVLSDYDYDLAADFSALLGGFTYAAGATTNTIDVIEDWRLLERKAQDDTAGWPQVAAVRAKAFDQTKGTLYEVLVHPKPSTDASTKAITYRYRAIPAQTAVDTAAYIPYGSPEHFETLAACCLAAAEKAKGVADGANERRAQSLMAEAVRADHERFSADIIGYNAQTVGTYGDLLSRVSHAMGWGFEPGGRERRMGLDIVREGYRNFLYPLPALNQTNRHMWSFLAPTTTLALVSGDYDYDLPTDFGSMLGDFTFAAGSLYRTVRQVPEQRIRELRAALDDDADYPQVYAVRPLSSQTRYEAIFYPTPNASKTLTYRYARIVAQATVNTLTNVPIGGVHHYEAIVACCMAVVERYQTQKRGVWWETMREEMTRAILDDQRQAPPTVGRYGDHPYATPRPFHRPGTISYEGTEITTLRT